jgi:hypothetical protein
MVTCSAIVHKALHGGFPRCIVSFLRYETKANPLARQERLRIRHALGFGIS